MSYLNLSVQKNVEGKLICTSIVHLAEKYYKKPLNSGEEM